VRIGSGAGVTSKTVSGAIAIGKNTASAFAQGINSIAIGTNAGNAIGLSEGTIAIGAGAGPTVAHGINDTYIGFGANGAGLTGFNIANPNQIVLGNTSTDVFIGRDAYANSFYATSDYRMKQNIKKLDNSYVLDNLRPVSYFNTKSQSHDIGFIAHEVQKEIPLVVCGEKDGEKMQSINYNGLIPILVKELNEQKQENAENKGMIERLVKRVHAMEQENKVNNGIIQELLDRIDAIEQTN
jgi:hypothetical protein